MSEYQAIKEKLLERKEKLSEIISRVKKSVRKPLESDWKEQVVQRENEEVLPKPVSTCKSAKVAYSAHEPS